MARTRATAALLFLGVTVSACASGATSPGRAEPNLTVYSVNQPVVQRTDYVIDLATGPEGVPATEIGRLHGWFQGLQIGYGDRIAVDEPAGGYSNAAVRVAVAEAAGRYGLLVEDGAPMTNGEVQQGTVRVVLSRTTASVPNCPNWERTGLSATSANYGCAMNSNLAAMVADPNDLVLGQTGTGTADPAATSRAIRSYRDAVPTGTRGLQQTTTTNGGR